MRTAIIAILAEFYLLATGGVRAGGAAEPTPIEITTRSNTSEANTLCYLFREKVRESHGFTLVDRSSESPHIHLRVLAFRSKNTEEVAVSFAWTLALGPGKSETFIMDQIGLGFPDANNSLVQGILAQTEKYWKQINNPAEP